MKLLPIFLMSIILFHHLPAQTESFPQKEKNHCSLSASFIYGKLLQTNDFVTGFNESGKKMSNYTSVTLSFLWQNNNNKNWQNIYHIPYYGIGFGIGNFDNPREVGFPFSGFGILGIPIQRKQWISIYSDFRFGIAAGWKHFDSISNPYNNVIGGSMTVHLDIGFKVDFHLTPRSDISGGISFIHFSNGGFERPNRGFNILSSSVAFRQHFGSKAPNKTNKPTPERNNIMYFQLSYGDHQLADHEFDTNYFAVIGLSTIYFRQLSNSIRLGVAGDFNYWMGLTAMEDGTMGPKNAKNITIGALLQPELIIDRLTLTGGIGIYILHKNYGNFKQNYQRLGFRFDIYKNFSLGMNVRSVNFILAEFLEFNIGYKIKYPQLQ